MLSPTGWRELPCVECGEYVPDIEFGARCPACFARRKARADRIGRIASLVSTLLVGAWVLITLPSSPTGRWYAALSVPLTYVLVRKIAGPIAMEALP
ncbi:MAG: hypothetical protein ABJC19_11250 [Gemmatimonadota bacterium]